MPNRNEFKFEIAYGPAVVKTTGEKEVPMTVVCRNKKGTIITNFDIAVESGGITEQKKTDTTGTFQYTAKVPAGANDITGKFLYKKGNTDMEFPWKYDPNAPAASTTQSATTTPTTASAATATPPNTPPVKPVLDDKDPCDLQVLRSELSIAGNYRFFARVLNHKGEGLPRRRVGFIYQGSFVEVETNPRGIAQYPPGNDGFKLQPGEEAKVTAFVSGISELATTVFCRRPNRSPKEIECAKANNQRARRFLFAALIGFAVWIVFATAVSVLSGWGEPLLSTAQTELSSQEKYYNTLHGVTGSTWEIKPEAGVGNWQKPLIFVPLFAVILWAIFSVIYGVFAMREEAAEAIRSGMESLVDRRFVRAQDPLFDRIAAWSGHLSRVSRSTAQQTAPSTATATPSAETSRPAKTNFWELFRSDLLSDFLIEIAPRIFRATIGRR